MILSIKKYFPQRYGHILSNHTSAWETFALLAYLLMDFSLPVDLMGGSMQGVILSMPQNTNSNFDQRLRLTGVWLDEGFTP